MTNNNYGQSSGYPMSVPDYPQAPAIPAIPVPAPVLAPVPAATMHPRIIPQANPATVQQHVRVKNVFMTNSFAIAGRICENGLQFYNGKVARFRLASNFNNSDPLYTECVIFAPKGGTLPEDLLRKGTAVVVSGFRRASTWVDAKGAKHYQIDHVVTNIQAISRQDPVSGGGER